MTLKLRLTLAYIALLVPALAIFSAVVYFIASHRLYSAVDDGLQGRIDGVESQLPHDHPLTRSDVALNIGAIERSPAAGFSFRILDLSGRVLYSSSAASSREIPDLGAFSGDSRFLSRTAGGQNLRVAYEPVKQPDGTTVGYIESATSLKQTDDALDQLVSVFVAGGILVVVATGGPAYFLAGRALTPVRQVSAMASDIERTADFSKQLPQNATRGETADLVRTFNAMIGRVDRMLVAQRDFLADSSHELRRPLAVIRTYIDVLGEPKLAESERRACLAEMTLEADAMAHLLSDLLLLSREGEQAMRRGEVDVSGICNRLIARLKDRDSQHRIHSEMAPRVTVIGDAERIERMISNLLDNAAENTPVNGEIDLRLSLARGMALIEVEDSGRGIPAEEQDQVFSRFFRGQSARSLRADGAGLGLAIVKHVAESHGGEVEFASASGRGTRFTVRLPALAAESL
jgi:two-component system sensor histidine kinase MprB